jgi:hypothetical protein
MAEALSRAVGLRMPADTELKAGSELILGVSPSATATARSLEGGDPTSATARATGLGAGVSSYYEQAGLTDPYSQAFFSSPNLSIASGGGVISGEAAARSLASGRGDLTSLAEAVNVALGRDDYLDRYGGALRIGSAAAPFTALARAASASPLGPRDPANPPTASLTARADVRGLEGDASQPTSVYGQPQAEVRAEARLEHGAVGMALEADAQADAVAIEHATVKAVPLGNGDGSAGIAGEATAALQVVMPEPIGSSQASAPPMSLDLAAEALGIDTATLYGAPTLNTTISASGRALLDFAACADSTAAAQQAEVSSLLGVGMRNSAVFTNQGDDTVTATGSIETGGVTLPEQAPVDVAGFSDTRIHTGLGDDTVHAEAHRDGEAQLDGYRNSEVNTGLGDDSISGSSNRSTFSGGGGDDAILLERAADSRLSGGIGDDRLGISGSIEGDFIVLQGGFGNDQLQGGSRAPEADGSTTQVLDGGFGQDRINGGDQQQDTFIYSNAAASMRATSGLAVNRALTSTGFWDQLSDQEKGEIWSTGKLPASFGLSGDAPQVDTVSAFEVGDGGDVLEMSSSLTGYSQTLWNEKGQILQVGEGGVIEGCDGCCSHAIGVLVGELADIQTFGICSPTLAYATDTRQLMFDADGDWSYGSVSLGTVNLSGDAASLSKENFSFATRPSGSA